MRIRIFFLLFVVISLSSFSFADDIVLTGKVKKESDNIYILASNGTTYLLSTNFKSPQRKAVDVAIKSKSDITVIGDYDHVVSGPSTGQILITPAGHKVFTVKTVLKANASGISEGSFQSLECGDSCYLTFTDTKGKSETYYANGEMSNFDKMMTDASLKGKNVKIYWEKIKKDRVAVLVVFMPLK